MAPSPLPSLTSLTLLFSPSSCTALKIHLSSETKAVLEEFGGFELELRGDVEMKVEQGAPASPPRGGPEGVTVPQLFSPLANPTGIIWESGCATPHPNFSFPPGQRQSSDLLAAGGAGD